VAIDEAELSRILAKKESDLSRDEIIFLVEAGLWRPSKAEAWAQAKNTKPFASRPNPADFDPLEEVHWSILMALAWIMGRNPDAVRECWPLFLRFCLEWHPRPPNPNFKPLRFPYLLATAYPNIQSQHVINGKFNVNKAILILRLKLQLGSINATSTNKDGIRKYIDPIEWCDLSFFTVSFFPDEFLMPFDNVIKLHTDDDLLGNYSKELKEYNRVLLNASEVLKEFPADNDCCVTNARLSYDDAKSMLIREIARREGFIDQASAAEFIWAIDPEFKRETTRNLVKSLTGNEKRGRRKKTIQTAAKNGAKSSSA